jgi:hypothetical protein
MGPFITHMNWALAAVNCLPKSFFSRWVPGMMSWFSHEPDAYSGWSWAGEVFFLKMKNDICRQIRDRIVTKSTEK